LEATGKTVVNIYGRNESRWAKGNSLIGPITGHCAIVVEEFAQFEVERLGTGRSTIAQNGAAAWVEARSACRSAMSLVVGY